MAPKKQHHRIWWLWLIISTLAIGTAMFIMVGCSGSGWLRAPSVDGGVGGDAPPTTIPGLPWIAFALLAFGVGTLVVSRIIPGLIPMKASVTALILALILGVLDQFLARYMWAINIGVFIVAGVLLTPYAIGSYRTIRAAIQGKKNGGVVKAVKLAARKPELV